MSGETAEKDVQIGEPMPDGTIYAGISPDTGKAMYTTPADAVSRRFPLTPRLAFTFNQAVRYAKNIMHGHQDWRVPTAGELYELFNNRAAIGGFDVSGSYPSGFYWSSMSDPSGVVAWQRRFSDGYDQLTGCYHAAALRCVRG